LWFERGTIKNFFCKENLWYKGIALFIGLLAVGLSIQQTFFNKSEQRFTDINIFADQNIKQQILQKVNFERTIDSAGSKLSIFFHNKPVEYFVLLKNAYIDNLSFNFLFISGDGNPVHNMTGIGELYLVEMALIFIGMISLWNKDRRAFVFILSWLLLSPVAGALLITPHALRDSFMLPPLILLSALGLSKIVEIEKKNFKYLCFVIIGALWLIQFVFLLDKLYFLSPIKYETFWSYPAKAAVTMANDNKGKFDYVFLSDKIDNAEYAYPVYGKIDPKLVIAENQNPYNFGKYKFRKYDNVYISDIPGTEVGNFISGIKGSVLYIGNPSEKITNSGLEKIESPTGLEMLSLINKYENN
jgi:hypothetical protein